MLSGRCWCGDTDPGDLGHLSVGISRTEEVPCSRQVMVTALKKLEGRVVSVVGLAHLDGMQSRWDKWQRRSRQLS